MFAFYRIPRLLMTHERFKDMSCDAKLLYGVLLARMELSQKNNWLDKNGKCSFTTPSRISWRRWAAPTEKQDAF